VTSVPVKKGSAPKGKGSSLTTVATNRKVKDRAVQVLVYGAFALAMIPLVSVLWTVVINGIGRLDADFFAFSMNGLSGRDAGGGAYHAIIGTLQQVAITPLIAVPIAILTAI
jgi:phosphate transport system permease protein